MTAAHICDAGTGPQLVLHALQGGNPLGDQVRAVGRPEGPLGSLEQRVAVLVPAHSPSGAEALHDAWGHAHHRRHTLEDPGQTDRARVVGQDERLLRRQFIGLGRGVVAQEAARRLRVGPLPHVALMGPGAGSKVGRRQRPRLRQHLVEPELVADRGQHRVVRRADLLDDQTEEGLQLALVDGCRRRGRPRRRFLSPCHLVSLPVHGGELLPARLPPDVVPVDRPGLHRHPNGPPGTPRSQGAQPQELMTNRSAHWSRSACSAFRASGRRFPSAGGRVAERVRTIATRAPTTSASRSWPASRSWSGPLTVATQDGSDLYGLLLR